MENQENQENQEKKHKRRVRYSGTHPRNYKEKYKETYIIGVDHGYGNMKTANCCFQTGVTVYEKEPI